MEETGEAETAKSERTGAGKRGRGEVKTRGGEQREIMELLLWLWSQLRSCGNNLPALGIALTVFALLFDFLKRRKRWSRYPPGPSSLPFLGTMLQIDFHNPHVSFAQVSARGAGEPSVLGSGAGGSLMQLVRAGRVI